MDKRTTCQGVALRFLGEDSRVLLDKTKLEGLVVIQFHFLIPILFIFFTIPLLILPVCLMNRYLEGMPDFGY
ncbi:MAG: hypothetical protein Q6361_03995, partial [Candidatus Hermodarchaeota archaeon]|nr:hypothetical protein [Candidatus Hermodarchaeota archaeon]